MKMRLSHATLLLVAAGTLVAVQANAATTPAPMMHSMKMPGQPAAVVARPDPAEAGFIADVAMVLHQRYATTAAATGAGYFQMTGVGRDGTMIWFNGKWDSDVDAYHPNFLWYDKAGRLVGLDYELTASANPKPPGAQSYPVAASRWTIIPAHMHFAYRLPDGKTKRRGARLIPHVTGDPTAAQLRAAKLLPPTATLLWSHDHPKSWDLGFWVVPNPDGAFAALDPLVKP